MHIKIKFSQKLQGSLRIPDNNHIRSVILENKCAYRRTRLPYMRSIIQKHIQQTRISSLYPTLWVATSHPVTFAAEMRVKQRRKSSVTNIKYILSLNFTCNLVKLFQADTRRIWLRIMWKKHICFKWICNQIGRFIFLATWGSFVRWLLQCCSSPCFL